MIFGHIERVSSKRIHDCSLCERPVDMSQDWNPNPDLISHPVAITNFALKTLRELWKQFKSTNIIQSPEVWLWVVNYFKSVRQLNFFKGLNFSISNAKVSFIIWKSYIWEWFRVMFSKKKCYSSNSVIIWRKLKFSDT